MNDRELMQQALYFLEKTKPKISQGSLEVLSHDATINALRNRLAKPHIKVEGPLHVVCQCDKCKERIES